MSRSYYSLSKDHSFTIRGTAKLLNVSSSRYGGDWHSVPHTHSHTELFYIVSGKGQFLIRDQVFPVGVNNLVIINPDVSHTEDSLNSSPWNTSFWALKGSSWPPVKIPTASSVSWIILKAWRSPPACGISSGKWS